MSQYHEAYHTHALGRDFGWWGQIVHSAHLGEDGRFIPHTEWAVEARAETLEAVIAQARNLTCGKLHGERALVEKEEP